MSEAAGQEARSLAVSRRFLGNLRSLTLMNGGLGSNWPGLTNTICQKLVIATPWRRVGGSAVTPSYSFYKHGAGYY